MVMLGACLGRKVWIDHDIHMVRPMLNFLMIGPSGTGKSTAVKIAKKLLGTLPENDRPQFFEGGATKEKLHKDLVHQPKAILFASELAAFFSREKYKESLIPYVTQLLDYEDVIEIRTVKDNVVRVDDPSVSIIGGSTVEWLQEQLPDSAVTGGFLARFLIMHEQKKGQKVANPHRVLTSRQKVRLDALRAETFAEFPKIVTTYAGAMDYDDYDAAETYANWYNRHEPAVGYLAPFSARAGEMILRLSMILAISGQRSAITKEDIDCAIYLYEYIIERLADVIAPNTASGKAAHLIVNTVGTNSLSGTELASALKSQTQLTELEKVMENLLYSGDLEGSEGLILKH